MRRASLLLMRAVESDARTTVASKAMIAITTNNSMSVKPLGSLNAAIRHLLRDVAGL
jgi:hypothetical protein